MEKILEGIKRLSQSENSCRCVLEVKSDAVKNNIAKEPGLLGAWIKVNWKWPTWSLAKKTWVATQAKEARVNIKILGISELKWTGMNEFNSDDHYIDNCG